MVETRIVSDKPRFTTVYNDFLESDFLDLYEKMLFIYLKKFADNDGKCFPSLQTLTDLSGMSKSKVQKTIKSLESKNVLTITHRKTKKGNVSNIYTIYDYAEMWRKKEPQKKELPPKNTEESSEPNRNDTLKNSNCQPATEKYTLEEIKEYYDYHVLIHDNPNMQKDIDSVISILYDILNTNKKIIKIMRDEKSTLVVQSKLLKLNYEHILYSIRQYDNVTEKIKNPSAYMLAILYQAEEQMNLDYKNQINCMYT